MRGSWFSWENGRNTLTVIDANTTTQHGYCVDIRNDYHVNYTILYRNDRCYTCVKFMVRTVNVLEKIQCKFCFRK